MLGLVGKYVLVTFLCGGVYYPSSLPSRFSNVVRDRGYTDCVLLRVPIKVKVTSEGKDGWCSLNLGDHKLRTKVSFAYAICVDLELVLDQRP